MVLSLMKDWWVITVNSQTQRSLDSRAISDNGENAPPDITPLQPQSILTRMDLSKIQVLKPNSGIGTLDPAEETTVKQVLREVADGGWVVLKGSTRATADSAKKDVVNNKVRLPPERKGRADGISSSSKQS